MEMNSNPKDWDTFTLIGEADKLFSSTQ